MKNYFLFAAAILCGSLFVSCDDDNDDNIKKLPEAITSFITQKYPDAKIIEFDMERTNIEVDIRHENIKKDVTFSKSNEWISTSWDIMVKDLPKVVSDAAATAHPTLRLDEADRYQTPTGDFYFIELEPGDVKIKVNDAGTILK